MTIFELDHEFEDDDLTGTHDHKRIVADAEKAFVNLLRPEYNIVKFADYPKGKDGLYGSEYTRYGYAVCEEVIFNTPHGRFRGSRHPTSGFITNDADSISIEGGTVRLFISGINYPGEPPSRTLIRLS